MLSNNYSKKMKTPKKKIENTDNEERLKSNLDDPIANKHLNDDDDDDFNTSLDDDLTGFDDLDSLDDDDDDY